MELLPLPPLPPLPPLRPLQSRKTLNFSGEPPYLFISSLQSNPFPRLVIDDRHDFRSRRGPARKGSTRLDRRGNFNAHPSSNLLPRKRNSRDGRHHRRPPPPSLPQSGIVRACQTLRWSEFRQLGQKPRKHITARRMHYSLGMAFESSTSASNDAQHDEDDSDNQENVNEPAHCRRGNKAQQPEDNEDNGNGFEHSSFSRQDFPDRLRFGCKCPRIWRL